MPRMGYGLGCKEDIMEKSKFPLSRLRPRYASVSVGLAFWLAFVMLHFSFERRPPTIQSPLGRPLPSLQTEEARPRGLTKGLSSDWSYEELDPTGADDVAHSTVQADSYVERPVDACEGRYIYVHELDPYFNEDMVKHCGNLSLWLNWCPSVTNAGLGPPLVNTDGVFSDSDWYITNQFMLEQIFHNRMKKYECLATDSSRAAAVFVPFYAAFDITTKLWGANLTVRDAACSRLYSWLVRQAEWGRFNGHDHFLIGGRTTWDFRRLSDEESDWGNKLFVLPPGLNMTMLTIEASPWHGNDVAIPYPTYFHPSSRSSMLTWQERMRAMERPFLFSFVGAPRPGATRSIRGMIIDQCIDSNHCRLLNCHDNHDNLVCQKPHNVMRVFEHSVFCLQPAGDSFTRRSIFDAMLAGCIPVFFDNHSAYSQYVWHLPSSHSSYSVFIEEQGIKNGTVRIEDVLLAYTPEQIASMRETVIQSIPGLVYADPRTSPVQGIQDAFDIAVQGVINRVAAWKRNTRNGILNRTSTGLEAQSNTEEVMKEHAAEQEAMRKSEDETGWRENNGAINS